jgi:hypothetical protein
MMRQAHASRMSIPSKKKKKVKKVFRFNQTRNIYKKQQKNNNNNNGNERKWPNAIDKPNVHTHKRNLKKK